MNKARAPSGVTDTISNFIGFFMETPEKFSVLIIHVQLKLETDNVILSIKG